MLPEENIDSVDKFKKTFDAFAKGSFSMRTQFPTIPNDQVDPEWVRGLKDTFYAISGVSMFFNALACKCNYHWSYALPTAGAYITGGKFHIVINPWFFMEFLHKQSWRTFVIMHEVIHIFYDHSDRQKECLYDGERWNRATDYYINYALYEMNEGLANQNKSGLVEVIPQEVLRICFDAKFANMTEDEIYAILNKEDQEKPQNGEGEGEGGGSGDDSDDGKQRSLEGFSKPEDQHESGEASNANSRAVASAIRGAHASVRQQGYKPGSDAEARLIQACLDASEPKVSWRDELADMAHTAVTDMLTYNKVNRRSNDEIIFPSRSGDHISVFFGTDTSGSMGYEAIATGFNEVRHVANNFDSHRIVAASCDAQAFVAGIVDSEEGLEFDADEFDIRGGGGTIMSEMVKLAQELHDSGEECFDCMIIFTDGELRDGDIEDEYNGDIPLIVIITADGNSNLQVPSALKIIQIND